MELKVFTETDNLKPIDFNYLELTDYIKSNLEKYNGLTFNEAELKDAKETRAKLNKLRTALDTRRKDIKKEWNKPYLEFEEKIKTLIELIDEPISKIDEQIKYFDSKYQDSKRLEINDYFNLKADKLNNIITLDKIWDNTWLNKTVKLDNIKLTIDNIINKIENDIQIINNLITNYKDQIKDKYINTLDLSLALHEQKRLEEQSQQVNMLFGDNNNKVITENTNNNNQTTNTIDDNINNTKKAKVVFEVIDILENIYKLRDFMKSNNINYRRITE